MLVDVHHDSKPLEEALRTDSNASEVTRQTLAAKAYYLADFAVGPDVRAQILVQSAYVKIDLCI